MNNKNKQGFTLVELSVVIIIIGLIIAGITKGSELIKSAQLGRYASEIQEYAGAYQSFVSKYNCVPGDCANAESYFGADNTNNGNGNGVIEHGDTTERFLGWNHLGLAELVPGQYTFASVVSGGQFLIGENIPGSSLTNVGFMLLSDILSIYSVPNSTYNALFIGKRRSGDGRYHVGYMTPSEAYAVDVKIDDGFPAKGNLLTDHGYNDSATAWYSGSCIASSGSDIVFLFSNEDTESCKQVFYLNKWKEY